jgi:hypothetical protein
MKKFVVVLNPPVGAQNGYGMSAYAFDTKEQAEDHAKGLVQSSTNMAQTWNVFTLVSSVMAEKSPVIVVRADEQAAK